MSLACAVVTAFALSASGSRIIEDDYGAALSKAKQEKKLLFVDAWAPWCHSCVFMREHVLTQPAFAAFEKQVVFCAVDTEKAKSAAFLEKHPVDVWPTLFFIDAKTETVVLRWAGSADATQMQALIAAAQKPVEADTLAATGRNEEAAKSYLAAAATSKSLAGRTVLSLLSALALSKQHEACARTADEAAPGLTEVSDKTGALSWGLGCALELATGTPDDARRRASLVGQSRAALTLEGAMADDVSGLYESLVEERRSAHDPAGAEALALEWLGYLEKVAGQATTPAARAVFDAHRVSAALAAHHPERVIEALRQSEKDLPRDYNPPARLALVLEAQGKLDEGLAAIDRALVKCTEGPRKLRLHETRARLQEAKGDIAGRRKTLQEAVAWARRLPKAQVSSKRIKALEEAAREAGAK